MPPIVPTELSELHSSLHGRGRRSQRGIEKIELQRARRYGMAEHQQNGRIKYTYGGVVFIYCPIRNKEVTSFRSPDKTGESTGTKFAIPFLLDKTPCDLSEYEQATLAKSLRNKPQKWTSHSVLVVDMSGSMRRDDVNGARCRSDGVFMALARDYIKTPLDRKERSAKDLISIVIMRDTAQVILQHEPTTYALYNKIIDLREWGNLRPAGPGNYLPAIQAAEELLLSNTSAGCALSLLFFSDGSPSDKHGDFNASIGNLAAKFGRRLSLACIGMADTNEDFSVLNDMVTEAKSYGSQASFGRPSLDSESLSYLITSLASSVTSTRSEMTDAKSGICKQVRDVTREKSNTPDDEGAWYMYERKESFRVVSVSTWQYKKNDFIELVDPRCAICYAHVGYQVNLTKGIVCGICNAFSVCYSCQKDYNEDTDFLMQSHRAKRAGRKPSQCSTYLSKVRSGDLIMKQLPSFFIAFKEKIFGEGAERIVRKVRFLDSQGQFTGPPMVAKESRFIENDDDNKQRRDYHRNFMRTQNISADFARRFNEALDNLPSHFPPLDGVCMNILQCLPRIKFIEPMVVEVKHSGRAKFFLMEKLLDGEYKKFNNNAGYVSSDARENNGNDESELINKMNNFRLGAIEEGEEDDVSDYDTDSSEDEEIEIENKLFDTRENVPFSGTYNFDKLKDAHIPQAFSHFSYAKSKKNFIVVDLQGVLTATTGGGNIYELTDPVIHRRNKKKLGRHWEFGRTDKGMEGIHAFFETHQCNEVCRLLGLEMETTSTRRG